MQVEDAKTMKRQTEWVVVLAVLAAIYLTLTLVTGIFGMNITEINTGETRPDRWSTVKAWAVVFGATIGGILVYIAVRKPIKRWLDRREELRNKLSDLEALKID